MSMQRRIARCQNVLETVAFFASLNQETNLVHYQATRVVEVVEMTSLWATMHMTDLELQIVYINLQAIFSKTQVRKRDVQFVHL